MNTDDAKAERLRRRRKALFRFRAVVRLVILNRQWLMEMEDQKMGPNIKRNIALITRRKGKKGILSITEKALLKKSPADRTPAERRRLVSAISSLKCFARYPPRVRSRLARVCFYMFYEAGKVIVKEGHRAGAMYFILDGEILVFKNSQDPLTNELVDKQVGVMGPGDMFGEVALLDKSERTATCVCGTNVELLCIYSTDFDKVLRETLQAQWDQIILAVKRFDVFNDWTKEQIRECCILSRVKEYDPLQIVYYEDKGLLNFVYFVLSGQCSILQCLRVQIKMIEHEKHYTLSNLALDKSDDQEIMNQIQKAAEEMAKKNPSKESLANRHMHELIAAKPEEIEDLKRPTFARQSNFLVETVQGARLSEAVKGDFRNIFQRDIDTTKEDPKKMEYHFIDVGTLTVGAIFGLGEPMQHRMIMAKTQVQCLLIPRFWLLQKAQNKSNIWRRTQMYLESTIPSRERLFRDFQANQKWRKYKKSLIKSLVDQKVNVNPTKVEDIPIICRIVEANDYN